MYRKWLDYELTTDDIRAIRGAGRVRVVMSRDGGYALVADAELRNDPSLFSKSEWELYPERRLGYGERVELSRRIPAGGVAYDGAYNEEDEYSVHFSSASGEIPFGPEFLGNLLKKGDKIDVAICHDEFTRHDRKRHMEWVRVDVTRTVRGKSDTFSFQPINRQGDWVDVVDDFDRHPQRKMGE